MNGKDKDDIKLQVMICTFGADGIKRVAQSSHPRVPGVEYLVSWQTDAPLPIPDTLLRDDIKIYSTPTKGLSVNRNHALSKASAPLLLIGDDDADYRAEGLSTVIDSFLRNPHTDIMAFRFDSISIKKYYPDHQYDFGKRIKGHYISSIEIAFRKDSVKGKIWFNEHFGIGAIFPSGEEDIFLQDCLEAGLKCMYIPKSIVRHDASTTSERNLMSDSRPQTLGAVFMRLHPESWKARMLVHAMREIPSWLKGKVPSPVHFVSNWIKGARLAKKMAVFPTPNHTEKYLHDE